MVLGPITRGSLTFLASLSVSAGLPTAGFAQEYPTRAVRWIIPYPPGGTSDFLARLIGAKLTDAWKQTMVIDNRAGANGNIGAEMVARAAPDGYTVLFVASTITINQSAYPNLTFDTAKDLAPVATVLWQPYVVAVHPSVPAASVKELVALARARPAMLDYSSGGPGNANHIAAELFAKMAGVKLTHVPYKGMGPGIAALLAGEVHLTFASLVAVTPHLKSGRMRALAVTGEKRIGVLPDLPTVSESGVKGYEEGNWQGVLVPAQTPRAIVARLNQELVRIVKSADISEQIVKIGADVVVTTPEQFGVMIRSDLRKYGELIKSLGLRLD